MPPTRSGPASHSYFSQRLRLHYADWGNEQAPPLLLVHGGRDHCRNWDWVAERLADRWHVVCPDLRGHGDSQWAPGSGYGMPEFVADIAQLVDQRRLAPVTIVGHSLGGMISLHYAGLFPDRVRRIAAIEGLGFPPKVLEERARETADQRLARWIDETRKLAARQPRRYPTLEDAYRRMQEENPHLSPDQARHLTVHGANQNEDGTYSWKFDNYIRIWQPWGIPAQATEALWRRIECPTLLIRGTESWASDPLEDGRARHFRNARVEAIEGAGHWAHHDRFEVFMAMLEDFLKEP